MFFKYNLSNQQRLCIGNDVIFFIVYSSNRSLAGWCKYCGITYISIKALKIHMAYAHGPFSFRCFVCKKEFNTDYVFKDHLLAHGMTTFPCGEDHELCQNSLVVFETPGKLIKHIKTKCLEGKKNSL